MRRLRWMSVATAMVLAPAALGQNANYPYGVACGDVTDTSAVLWSYNWGLGRPDVDVSESPDFVQRVGTIAWEYRSLSDADSTADFGYHAVVTDLQPDRTYYYRFLKTSLDDPPVRGADFSPVGRFRTLPAPDSVAPLRFAISGDSNFAYAPFTLLGSAAQEDAAFFIWLGDTVYADVPSGDLGVATELYEYRAKYQQVRGDPHVQALSAAMATIVQWDDHEVRNDYAGADGATPATQRDAAYQAFFEYMPCPDQGVESNRYRTYRRIACGANIEFFVLDGRQYREASARMACGSHPDPTGYIAGEVLQDLDCAARLSDPRTMLGAEQLEWLLSGLRESTAGVKFIVTPVPLQFLGIFPYDRWDGYDAERRTILEFIANNAIVGVFFLTTDFHGNFYNPDVLAYFRKFRPDYNLGAGITAPELIVGPIGQETFQHTLDELRERYVPADANPALIDALESIVYRQLERVSGVTFVEPNKLAYAVINVSADGDVSFELKGVEQVASGGSVDSPPTASAFFQTVINPPPSASTLPCCAAPLLLGAVGGGFWYTRRRHGLPPR